MYKLFLENLKKIIQTININYHQSANHALGGKKHSKREVLGKTLVIYKIPGDRKEYVKHKGKLTTVKDYKALMKQKAKPKKMST